MIELPPAVAPALPRPSLRPSVLPSFPRRMFLRGAGATIALPLLDSLARRVGAAEPAETPRRMIAICTSLGLLAENWIPKRAGRDYDTPLYLEPLAKFRNDYTVFSGVSHPEVDGGHFSEASFLTAAPHPKVSTFKNTISLDQYVVERLAPETRYPYLALGTYERSLSWTAGGVQIPADNSPSLLFRKLFVNGSPDEVETQVHRLRTGQSILDAALGQTKRIHRRLDGADREKLDQYMTAVRDVEQRLRTSEAWVHRPKPNVTLREPVDNANPADLAGRTRLMIDLMHLAIQTDSTRVITLCMDALAPGRIPLDGVTMGHHNLSHHGMDPEKLNQLRIVELEQMRSFAYLLGKLRSTAEQGGTLLDRTMVLFGSNLGNASSHDTRNMPMFLAGGGFKHGQHLAFDRETNYPLPNLYVSMLQRLGIETDRFASGAGTMTGLEPA